MTGDHIRKLGVLTLPKEDNKDIDIVLWIEIIGAYGKYRQRIQPMFIKDPVQEIFPDNKDSCRKLRVQGVAIAFNIVDVDFDSGSAYYIRDGEKIEGVEKKDVSAWLVVPGVQYERAMHNLADPKTIRNRQVQASKPQGYSTVHYKFPMSCSDLENSILVVDGLYYHGKRLPPLKVRLNYINFDEVPKYTGNGVNQVRQ